MRTPPVGVPFVPGFLSRGTRQMELLKDCPACGETIVCRRLKDGESFSGVEFAEHYLAHDGWRLVECCDECGSYDEFPFPKILEQGRGAYCAGCVGVHTSPPVDETAHYRSEG